MLVVQAGVVALAGEVAANSWAGTVGSPPRCSNSATLDAHNINPANCQREAYESVPISPAAPSLASFVAVFVDHLEQQRRNAFLLLVILEVVAGATMAPFAVKFVLRRPTSNLPFIRHVATDLAARRLAGAFRRDHRRRRPARLPRRGRANVEVRRDAGGAIGAHQSSPAAVATSVHRYNDKPRSEALQVRSTRSAKQRSGPVNRCRANTADGSLCRNRVSKKGDRCHLHRRFFG